MSYEQYRRWIMHTFPDTWKGPTLDLVAGSFSGGTAVLLTYPLDLIRTKLAYQVKHLIFLPHILDFFWRDGGKKKTFADLFILGLRFSPVLLLQYLNGAVHLKLQVVGVPKLNGRGMIINEQAYKGILDCFTKTYRESGIRGLYRGVGMPFQF